jgi:hypothetical protein
MTGTPRKSAKSAKSVKVPVTRMMRECALADCKVAFYPQRDWQKFHDPACAVKDRQRRLRERYRKLLKLNSGDITAGVGGRKVVSRRGSREITRAEAAILEQIRKIGQPAMDMVKQMLDSGPPRNRSPENGVGQASPAPPMISHRLRNVRRIHPRSLEGT